MTWTFDEIRGSWLNGGQIAITADAIVEAFERTEQVLGRDWIEQSRLVAGSPTHGADPVLKVFAMGRRLASIEGVAGADVLTRKLSQKDDSAEAELTAIYLLRSLGNVEVELSPPVIVGKRERQPDFRIRQPGESWTYVEVTKPDVSEVHRRAAKVLERLSRSLGTTEESYALEVFLRREPTNLETERIAKQIRSLDRTRTAFTSELAAGLGLVFLNHSLPGEQVFKHHQGEVDLPRLLAFTTRLGALDGIPARILVSIPFADERAEQFLKSEAKQLPRECPGLVMVEMAQEWSGFRSWVPLLRRRFQRMIHTRVGAVCLFSISSMPTHEGGQLKLTWLPHTKVLANPYARNRLPSWITEVLKEAGADAWRGGLQTREA